MLGGLGASLETLTHNGQCEKNENKPGPRVRRQEESATEQPCSRAMLTPVTQYGSTDKGIHLSMSECHPESPMTEQCVVKPVS